MVAGILSVAIMLGAEITRDFPLLSDAFRTPSNWLFFEINAPMVRAMPPRERSGFPTFPPHMSARCEARLFFWSGLLFPD